MARTDDARVAGTAAQGEVVSVLLEALRALGQAGHPVQASRYAARAWSVLRHESPEAAARINTLMHYLARLPAEDAAASQRGRSP